MTFLVDFLVSAIVNSQFIRGGKKLNDTQLINTYFPLAVKYGDLYSIPSGLILAVIKQESGGNFRAVGGTGDFGLMQITKPALTDFNYGTGKNYSLLSMLSPEKCIEVGSWYLYHLSIMLGKTDWQLILRAYNAGIGRISTSNDAGLSYANSVLIYWETFKPLLTRGI